MRKSIILLACSAIMGMSAIGTALAAPLILDYPEVDQFDGYMCDSDRECEEATGYPYDVAMRGDDAPKYPGLVGIDCEGTLHGAPIYAFEEDHFPKCREIRAMDWDWKER